MRRNDAMRRHASQTKQSRSLRPLMESMEDRVLMATFIVKDTVDQAPNPTTPDTGSLRYVLGQALAAGGSNTIQFVIPGGGAQTIALNRALPAITSAITFDGTTMPGYAGAPLVVLNGSGAGQGVDGLDISGGGSTVRGLDIVNFSGEGISLSGAGGNTIANNYIGVNAAGSAAAGNGLDGILVGSGSNTNTITGNTISGNQINGIFLNGNSGGTAGTSGNVIAGNRIGTDATGAFVVSTSSLKSVPVYGIELINAPTTTIGGTGGLTTRNVISGNFANTVTPTYSGGSDIGLISSYDGTIIEGNYIGTNANGTAGLNNANGASAAAGIDIVGVTTNLLIGGTTTAARNVISGPINEYSAGSTGILVQGNYIGTNATASASLGNPDNGIVVQGSGMTIGGTAAGAGNVIAGNGVAGISISQLATNVVIQGNAIGTNAAGTATNLGNGGDGITTQGTGIVIGGAATGAGNIIAYNGATGTGTNRSGVQVGAGGTASILYNSIHDNQNLGIELDNGGNNSQPAPVLTSAVSMITTSTIAGSLTAVPGTYTLQFFYTPNVNASGNTEGQTLIGTATLTIAGTGNVAVTRAFTQMFNSGFLPGALISATATTVPAATGTAAAVTSPFSAGIFGTGTGLGSVPPTITVTAAPSSVAAGDIVTDTFTITNNGTATDLGVGFVDTIPAGTTFFAGSTSVGTSVTVTNGVAYATIGRLAPGASATVTILLQTGAGAVPQFTNTGYVTATTPTVTVGSNDSASVTTAVTPSDDLYTTDIGPSDPVQTGQTITYTITVGNNGPSTATGVVLTDTLPAGTTFVSATSSTGETATVSGNVVTDVVGTLAAGGLVTITIVAQTSGATGASVTNSATVAGDQPDSDPTNNTSTATTTVIASADLAVTSDTVAPTAVVAGNTVTFTINVANNGPSAATGAVLTDTLPAGLTFVSGTAAGGQVTASNGVVTAPLGNIASGFGTVVTIVAMTGPAGNFADSAVVSSEATDPDPTNNTGSATVAVNPLVDLSVSLSGPTGQFNINNPITYTAVVTNAGPSPATNVVLTDPLFAGGTFQSATVNGAAAGSVAGNVVSVPLGTIAAGATVTVTIVILPTQAGTVTNTVTVTSAEGDLNTVNNASSITTVLVVPQPIIEFSATTYTTNENAGTATITLNRVGDMSGTITVHFSTVAGGNATPGLDYTPVSTTVTFPAGVATETVTVPVLANPYDRTNEFVNLQLDTPTDAILPNGEASASAVLEIINLDPVLVGPTVGDVRLYGTITGITGIEIQTTGGLDPARAAIASNYTLIAYGGTSTGDFAAGTVVPAAQAVYNPATGLILVIPSVPLPTNELFLLDINGTRANGITDLAGNPLNSVYGSVGASDYLLTFARGNNLTYTDENGALVNITLTGPGTIDIDRTVAGQVGRLQVLGATSKTTIAGTVSNSALNRTTIGTVLGLGQFGSIVTKLYTPPFYTTTSPYPDPTNLVDTAAVDTLIGTNINPTTTTTTKKKHTKVTKAKATTVAKHPHAAVAHATAHARGR